MKILDELYDLLGMFTLAETMKPERIESWPLDGMPIPEKEQYHSEQIEKVKFDYTPQTLSEYIGQENAKSRIAIYVKKVHLKPCHLIISGTRGHGKSTLVYIIANILGAKIDTYVGGNFTIENLHNFINKNHSDNELHILFIDEVHGISRETSEYMLPILQSFILPNGNKKIKPFIMMGATTNLEILQKSSQPFLDRCDLLELEHYNADDIKQMMKNYNDKLYQKNITEEAYNLISINTRFNPRTALSLFDDFVITEDLQEVFRSRNIVKNGLTTKDIVILEHLKEIKKPVGIEVLAVITNQTRESYKEIQEPFLLRCGYISRTARGRVLTLKGETLLQELTK